MFNGLLLNSTLFQQLTVYMKESRVRKSCRNGHIPEDLWFEVLWRLPVKSLVRFRSVSRSWRALIDNPDFTSTHLDCFQSNQRESRLFLYQDSFKGNTFQVRYSETFKIDNKESENTLESFPARVKFWYGASSIDGLFLIKSQDGFMLWNPSIRKTRIVPDLFAGELHLKGMKFHSCLGFDPSNKDYKIVRFANTSESRLRFARVYSIRTDTWKKIAFRSEGYPKFRFPEATTVCFRGILYAINLRSNSILDLVSFDLSKGTLDSTSLPVKVEEAYTYPTLTVAEGGRSLALVRLTTGDATSVQVMQSAEGDIKPLRWTKRYTFTLRVPKDCTAYHREPYFLYLKKNGEVLLNWGQMVTSYNHKTQEEKMMMVEDIDLNFWVWAYKETLILLN